MDLLQTFTNVLQTRALVNGGDHVLVALSGGPDSVALFDMFCRVRKELDLTVSAAHFNHGLRGTEADDDEHFVKKLCDIANVKCCSERGDVQGLADNAKMSIEQAAREMRYEFLERTAKSIGADAIATGHTANDQAETILDHLLRGSGINGLQGIPPKRGKFIRPLLWIQRREIMAYIHERNLEYRIDSSNDELQFRRNKIRHELLPLLQRQFNPRIVSTLNRLANIMSENEALLVSESRKSFEQCVKSGESDKIVLDILCFLTYFKVIQKYMVILGLEELGVSRDQVDFAVLEQVISNIERKRSGKVVRVGKDCQVYVSGNELVLQRKQDELALKTVDIDLRKDSHQLWGGLILRTKQFNRKDMPATFPSSSCVEVVDWQKLETPIRVRVFKQGDRFFPLNMRGSKKLSDFFIDEKIPIYRRHEIPILESAAGIVWVCGYRLDERFKVTPKTKKVLQLEVLREEDA